ncbi:MAG TPA: RodZ domain-containing protein [Chloroflexota bacterium]|nr:RodZ domain-containing protein [Chloroflexota bacterium]
MQRNDDVQANLRGEGAIYRRERLRRRLSVEQTANVTRLRPRVIQAIEEGALDQLPPLVFTTGLVTTYARFLGIDPVPFLEICRATTQVPAEAVIRPESRTVRYRSDRIPGFLVPTILSLVLIVLGGYLYQQYAAFVRGGGLGEGVAVANADPRIAPTPFPSSAAGLSTPAPASATPRATVTPLASSPAAPTATAPPATATPPPPTPTPHPQGVHVDVQISGRVWTQVEADGKVIFSGILNSGDKQTWSANDSLMLWTGNAGLMTVTYNGKSLGKLGSPGEVMKVTWTATP